MNTRLDSWVQYIDIEIVNSLRLLLRRVQHHVSDKIMIHRVVALKVAPDLIDIVKDSVLLVSNLLLFKLFERNEPLKISCKLLAFITLRVLDNFLGGNTTQA